jgi:hypothetical protein
MFHSYVSLPEGKGHVCASHGFVDPKYVWVSCRLSLPVLNDRIQPSEPWEFFVSMTNVADLGGPQF